ncbi:uncharacterized protein LOC131046326 [Cryptomeria japonica]|uniref:uncharacterized protein LOC131046326 n=1 Tax=Cryptomeria japonica TaxID=3369 RepID=UPI0027D9EA3A|nr:uncharacterized protein LOC131046326 [Cryptomeria japonica]
MANSLNGRLKRKGTADIEAEYSYGDVLASTKRFRLNPELPVFCGERGFLGVSCDDTLMQIPEMPNFVEISELQQPAEPSAMATEPLSYVPNDEKALVLYKPINPPIFPGLPAAGSPDLPIKFNMNCFSNHKAWEIQGRGNLPDLFRLARRSDPASNMKISTSQPVDNRLAVVPWTPSQFPTCVQELSLDQKSGCDNVTENEDHMMMDEDNVASMEEDPIQPPQAITACNNVVNEINSDGLQWQHCMTPQSPLNPQVMWSY